MKKTEAIQRKVAMRRLEQEMKSSATYITSSGITYENLDANSDIGTGAGQVAIGNHTHPGGSEAFPIGAVFIAVVSTNPNTLLGYGTWSAFGAGRVLVGLDSGDTDFDVAEETGGAKTVQSSAQTFAGTPFTGIINHTHPVTDPGHTHLTQRYPTSTGGSSGFTVDASMSGTLADNTLPTKINTTGLTTNNPTGGVASITPAGTNTPGAATSVVQPYIVCYFWKRTA